jgi:hypothetical protein
VTSTENASAEERLRIDAATKQKGFEGVSDFVRWASEAAGR